MVSQGNPYVQGYEAAYREIYSRLNDENHQRCGCRPCGVATEVVEILMESLATRMSQQDFFELALLLARTGNTAIGEDGHVRVDWWGVMNDAVNPDGSYDWEESAG